MAIRVQRDVLAEMLRSHGEDELAERSASLGDDELALIGTLGAYYAWSEDATKLGIGLGGARALSLATINVLEETGRELRRYSTDAERAQGYPEQPSERERARELDLRRHAAERQIPADESKRVLDVLDPPAWGPAPPDATLLVRRCHELRTKPLRDFTDEDLSVMIGQQVGLNHLVWRALDLLRLDSGVGDDYPTELLASLLRVDTAFWDRTPDYDQEVHRLAAGACERFKLAPELRGLIETFNLDHSARRIALRARLAS
jgi:hypothetical protein